MMMMARALWIVGIMATLGVAANGMLGYRIFGETDRLRLHLFLGMASALLLLFSHCWIMFYLIGTGKAIKEAVLEYGLDRAIIARTHGFKGRSYPWLMLAMAFAMATVILGGGAFSGAVPLWVHHTLFYLTLAAQARTLWIEREVLSANDRLIADINRRVRSSRA